MAFPEYKKGWFRDKPIGWEDMGEIEETYGGKWYLSTVTLCEVCKARARVGKENGKVFHYCYRCEVKLL